VVGRYRLVLVAALLPHAAATAVRLGQWLHGRAWRPALATAAAVVVIAATSTTLLADRRARLAHRLNEPIVAALHLWAERRDADAAFAELRRGLAQAWRTPGSDVVFAGGYDALKALMVIAARAGRPREVIPDIEALLAEYPEDALLHEYAAEHWRDRIGDEARAAEHFAIAARLRERSPP